MNDPKLDYPNEFPVELTPPDISCYKNTNTGPKTTKKKQ